MIDPLTPVVPLEFADEEEGDENDTDDIGDDEVYDEESDEAVNIETPEPVQNSDNSISDPDGAWEQQENSYDHMLSPDHGEIPEELMDVMSKRDDHDMMNDAWDDDEMQDDMGDPFRYDPQSYWDDVDMHTRPWNRANRYGGFGEDHETQRFAQRQSS